MKKFFVEPVITLMKLQETEAIADDIVEVGPGLSGVIEGVEDD